MPRHRLPAQANATGRAPLTGRIAFQTELAEHRDFPNRFSAYLFGCRKNPERDRQVEGRSLLFDVGRVPG